MIEDTTEITLEEDELIAIVQKHFDKTALVHHAKHGKTRGSMYTTKEGTFRFEFRSITEGREIPE